MKPAVQLNGAKLVKNVIKSSTLREIGIMLTWIASNE